MESGYRGTGIRAIRNGDGNQDLGVRGLGSGDPGTGIRVSGVSGDCVKFEAVGIEIWVSGFGDWNPWTGTWVSWDLGGLGSGDFGRGSETRSLTHSSNLRGLGLGSGHLGTGSGHPGTGIWGSGIWKSRGSGAGMSGSGDWERLGGQILDTFVKSEAWGGSPGAEGIGVRGGFPGLLGPPKVLST